MIEEDKEAIIELLHGNTRDLSVAVVMCDDIDETCANDKSKKISNRESERERELKRATERHQERVKDTQNEQLICLKLLKFIRIYLEIVCLSIRKRQTIAEILWW